MATAPTTRLCAPDQLSTLQSVAKSLLKETESMYSPEDQSEIDLVLSTRKYRQKDDPSIVPINVSISSLIPHFALPTLPMSTFSTSRNNYPVNFSVSGSVPSSYSTSITDSNHCYPSVLNNLHIQALRQDSNYQCFTVHNVYPIYVYNENGLCYEKRPHSCANVPGTYNAPLCEICNFIGKTFLQYIFDEHATNDYLKLPFEIHCYHINRAPSTQTATIPIGDLDVITSLPLLSFRIASIEYHYAPDNKLQKRFSITIQMKLAARDQFFVRSMSTGGHARYFQDVIRMFA